MSADRLGRIQPGRGFNCVNGFFCKANWEYSGVITFMVIDQQDPRFFLKHEHRSWYASLAFKASGLLRKVPDNLLFDSVVSSGG